MFCSECKYWIKDAEGECRRFPPVASTLEYSVTNWLNVPSSGFCGEYKPRKPKEIDGALDWGDFAWSRRILSVFCKHDILTLLALLEHSPSDLVAYKAFGLTSLREVERKLAEVGLCLKSETFDR